jgi:uncharacterized Zn finger protein
VLKYNSRRCIRLKFYFSEEQKQQKLNHIYLEEDDLLLEGETLEGEGKNYIITGIATVEGERYHDFQVEFELVQLPKEASIEAVMDEDWEWYDFVY